MTLLTTPEPSSLAHRHPGHVTLLHGRSTLLDGRSSLLHRRAAIGKRAFDLAVTLVVLPLAAVLIALCAVLIRLDSPGPALYTQQRTGRDGRTFRMWKLRTMVANADELKAELAHLNVLPPPDFKIPDDPRITRVGRFLRATSLDELPQVVNVLKGDMSLVGPRPTSFAVGSYEIWHSARLEVPPGITGLWQVRARHGCAFDERVRLDIRYVDEHSFWLDLRVLVATLTAVVGRTGE